MKMGNMQLLWLTVQLAIILVAVTPTFQKESDKYSKEANLNYRELNDPFRMAKVNAVWRKAMHKLTDTKLKSLYADLSAHDKEETKLKRLVSDGLDKEGLQEANVRKKFRELLSNYGLLEHFVDGAVPSKPYRERDENEVNKSIFKDKKLGKLWEKAERSGFDQKELKMLKQEFIHHQDKIDEYYSLLEETEKEKSHQKHQNFLDPLSSEEDMEHMDKSKLPSKKYPDGGIPVVNQIRTKHRDIKDGYDVLHKKVASGPDSQEFSEPRVANLWKLALKADFSPDELESLRQELKHYEKRLEKLHYFQSEQLAKKVHAANPEKELRHTDKDTDSFYSDKIKRHERHIAKMHFSLESKIVKRHNEL